MEGSHRARGQAARLLAAAYVVAVGLVATIGFARGSTHVILLSAAMALPSSIATLIAF